MTQIEHVRGNTQWIKQNIRSGGQGKLDIVSNMPISPARWPVVGKAMG
jgi:hypothetical protein